MAPTGPRDDFHNQPTQHVGSAMSGPPPSAGPPPTAGFEGTDVIDGPGADPFDEEVQPTPWYRRPVLLVAWLAVVLLLIGLIAFGLMELLRGEEGTSHTPSTTPTTSTTTSTTQSTTPSTTTAITTTEPSTSGTGQPAPQQPTQQPSHQSTPEPSHRHHLPPLPPVITIPQVPTVITVPPGLR